MKNLRDNQLCYVCGSKNEAGLRVAFEIDRDAKSIKGRFTPAAAHQGYEGIVHGGIISALLDEAMAKLAFSLGLPAVTAEMTVKFRSPAAPGEELLVTGRLLNIDRRLVLGEAKVEKGLIVIAEATGKLVKVS
jgi:uncharacterized protein (TIGR00369 family)